MKRLIIARHGNTFTAEQTPTRVGRHTDLPLVEETLGRNIGRYLAEHQIHLSKVYAAPLQRTIRTAQLIIEALPQSLPIIPINDFLEIDYGVDENQSEDRVIDRLGRYQLALEGNDTPTTQQIINAGKAIIDRWNRSAQVPPGWQVDVHNIISNWQNFANRIKDNETVLLVSSNGIIRFVPHLLGQAKYQQFIQTQSLKVKTGSLAIFDYLADSWQCTLWNERPKY
ncbi:MAG: histidine phosphatase family protein [Candidatus Schmidhempelia sp.]|nr:histidine phosphatase family protein [Candidatus Schmidhempelia sp.]